MKRITSSFEFTASHETTSSILVRRGLFAAFILALVLVPISAGADTVDFPYTGAVQTFVVPSGVTMIDIEAWGAQGYSTAKNDGGLGGYTSGQYAVSAADILSVYVGGEGTVANVTDTLMGGGFNGGGDGVVWWNGDGHAYAGGGGGASDVRAHGTTLNDRILVAGGGGGSSNNTEGGGGNGGGPIGADAEPYNNGREGLGGTQTAGGYVGGGFGYGGDAINNGDTGWVGGGGGGWYGGGASPMHGGGGGGSSYIGGVSSGVMLQGVNDGNGSVRFTYTVAVPEPSTFTLLCMGAFGLLTYGWRKRR